MTSNGVALFAYNNKEIDYLKIALMNAKYVKRHMKNNKVCLILDEGTYSYLNNHFDKSMVIDFIDSIFISKEKLDNSNKRLHHDSPYSSFTTEFYNTDKHKIYEYTPFDKTLLIDADYIIHDNYLDKVFDSNSFVSLFHHSYDLKCEEPHISDRYLSLDGIPTMWSTVIYFDKSNPLTKLFFDIWSYVCDNYNYYRILYEFNGNMYRTDFCVSIAKHLMNGFQSGNMIDDFEGIPMRYMSQRDDIIKINNLDEWIFLSNNNKENWKDTAVKFSNSVHIMNKRALLRHWDTIMEMFDNE